MAWAGNPDQRVTRPPQRQLVCLLDGRESNPLPAAAELPVLHTSSAPSALERGTYHMPPLNLKALAFLALGLIIAGLLAYIYIVTGQRDTARARLEAAEARHIAFANDVKAKAENMIQRVRERNRRVASDQDRITKERTRALQAQLDDVRRRFADLLRRPSGGTNPGRAPGGDGVPSVPRPGGGSDAAALPGGLSPSSPAVWLTLEDALVCTQNSLTLVQFQQWAREQMAVDRTLPNAADPASNPRQ